MMKKHHSQFTLLAAALTTLTAHTRRHMRKLSLANICIFAAYLMLAADNNEINFNQGVGGGFVCEGKRFIA